MSKISSNKESKHPNEGPGLSDLLKEESIYEESKLIAAKRILAWEIEGERKRQKLTKQELAKRMNTSRTQLNRILDPHNTSLTFESMISVANALGKELEIKLI